MRRLSERQQLWISLVTACLCVGIALTILHNIRQPSSEVLPVIGATSPHELGKTGTSTSPDINHQEELILAGLNCMRKQEGLPLFEAFDPALSETAAQALVQLRAEDKVLEALEGYTIRALLALDFAQAPADCAIAGLDLSFLAPTADTTRVGIAFSPNTSYGVTSAVLLGR